MKLTLTRDGLQCTRSMLEALEHAIDISARSGALCMRHRRWVLNLVDRYRASIWQYVWLPRLERLVLSDTSLLAKRCELCMWSILVHARLHGLREQVMLAIIQDHRLLRASLAESNLRWCLLHWRDALQILLQSSF